MTGFLALCGGLFLLLAMHPFVTYPLTLLLLRRKSVGGPGPRSAPTSFAICMCAYNEERVIEAKMLNLMRIKERHPGLEILLYVDCSTDRTAEIVSRYRQDVLLVDSKERRGKTFGMNLLVSKTDADIIVFTDANVMLADEILERLDAHFADPRIGCVSGQLTYTNPGDSVTAASSGLYWRLEEFIKRLEQRSGSIMGADGSLFAIRRSLHKQPPEHIIDDMYVSLMVLCAGYRVVQATDVCAYEESATSGREEFQRKVRIACQAFNVHRLIWPHLRKLDALTLYKYTSHKYLRWMTIYWIGLSAASFGVALLTAGRPGAAFGLLVALPGLLVLSLRWPVPLLSRLADALLAFVGVGLGVWRSIRGEVFQTWTPASSVRK